jgi:hypothetical protein
MTNKEMKFMIIDNFINHWTTDLEEQDRMKDVLAEYVDEDHVDELLDFVGEKSDIEGVLSNIKRIVKDFGIFSTADILAECDVCIPTIDGLIHLASIFNYDNADVEIYRDGEENEIDSYKLSYYDMNIDTLNDVLEYCERWEAQCLEDEDRQS